jgi:competence protein ComEC
VAGSCNQGCYNQSIAAAATNSPHSLGHRAPLLWLILPWLAGLAAGPSLAPLHPPWLLAAAAGAGVSSLVAALWFPRVWAPSLIGAVSLAGAAQSALRQPYRDPWANRPPREVRLTLRLDRVAPPKAGRRASGLGTVLADDRRGHPLVGQRLYFTLFLRRGQAPPVRSAVIAAAGVLRSVPAHPPADSFEGYLAGLGVHFQLAPAWLRGEVAPAGAYPRFCEQLARRMDALLRRGLESRPALSAVYRAMMLGRKGDLQDTQKEQFMHSGTMHLFAINGLHIGIVAVSLHALLTLLRCPRALRAGVVLAVLWLDVDSTGATPSAVRAWIMVAALECASVLNRPGNPLAALALAAAVDLCARPQDLGSASFQMSYGVVTALLTLGLPLAETLQARYPAYRFLPEASQTWRQRGRAGLQHHLLGAGGVGAAAALASAVSGVQYFSVCAPLGLLANLVLMPLATLVIVAGFGSVMSGLAGIAPLSRLFNHAAGLLLRLIDALIRAGVTLPGAFVSAHYRADWIGPAALAALLGACLAGYAGQWRPERGGWWPPFLVVALTLTAGVRYG